MVLRITTVRRVLLSKRYALMQSYLLKEIILHGLPRPCRYLKSYNTLQCLPSKQGKRFRFSKIKQQTTCNQPGHDDHRIILTRALSAPYLTHTTFCGIPYSVSIAMQVILNKMFALCT